MCKYADFELVKERELSTRHTLSFDVTHAGACKVPTANQAIRNVRNLWCQLDDDAKRSFLFFLHVAEDEANKCWDKDVVLQIRKQAILIQEEAKRVKEERIARAEAKTKNKTCTMSGDELLALFQ